MADGVSGSSEGLTGLAAELTAEVEKEELGTIKDLLRLDVEPPTVNDWSELLGYLEENRFTQSVAAGIVKYTGEEDGVLNTGYSESIGVFSAYIEDRGGSGPRDRWICFAGKRSNGGLFDYDYMVEIPLGWETEGMFGNILSADEIRRLDVEYKKGGDEKVVLSKMNDQDAQIALQLIQIGLSELIAVAGKTETNDRVMQNLTERLGRAVVDEVQRAETSLR